MRYFIYTVFFSLFICTTSEAQELKTFKTYEELNQYLSEPKDKPLVVNFWATWCAPCVKELPYFEELHQKNSEVTVITVSLDFEKQVESKLIPFLKKKKYTFITTFMADHDYNNWLHLIDPNWSGSIPATLIINKNKRTFIEQEFASFDELNKYVNQTINN